PRSRCPQCGHTLRWYENIPVLSWLVLRGRCSKCKARISFRYPAIELLTTVLFLACLQRFGLSWQLVSAFALVCLLVVLTFLDLEDWTLPFEITVPGTFAGIALALPLGLSSARDAAIGALAGFIAFWILEIVGRKLFRKEALGGGDKALLALLGAYLTYRPL